MEFETGTFQEDVGILLAMPEKEEFSSQVTKAENQWIRNLQAGSVKNRSQMDKRLKETMAGSDTRRQPMGPVIWIVPKEGESEKDDGTAGIL